MTRQRGGKQTGTVVYSAERAKAFIDAVVAIAMTLLILPLMESVADLGVAEEGGLQWVLGHWQQLIAFVTSFVVIALFWTIHHRLFSHIEKTTTALLWIVMAWLLTIVWLPVATAMTGQMSGSDALVKVVYIGSMAVTCLVTLIIRVYLKRHPALHDLSEVEIRNGMAADLSTAVLFAVALAVSILVPAIGYFALILLYATEPVKRMFLRMLRAR